jgi:hypothetical protein
MGRTQLLVVLFSAIAAAIGARTASAQEKPQSFRGVPPRFVTVLQIDQQAGEQELVNVTVRFVAEEVIRQVKQDGKVEEATETIHKPVYEEKMVGSIALDSADVFEAGGKKLSSDEVWKRVAVGAAVVVSADGKKVNPAYLRALAKDTLVFVSPQIALQAAGARGGALLFPRKP